MTVFIVQPPPLLKSQAYSFGLCDFNSDFFLALLNSLLLVPQSPLDDCPLHPLSIAHYHELRLNISLKASSKGVTLEVLK
jgi:hypothetical protein